MRRSLQILFVLTLSLLFVPVAVLAQGQTPNNQNGKNHGWGTNRNTAQNNTATNRAHRGWGPQRTTPPVSTASRTSPSNPQGWAQGQKVGWHGNDMPPGQARRDRYEHGRRRHHEHHRDFDRDHDRFRHDHDRFRHDHDRFRHDRDHDHDRH
jgi:hypothetical protein